MRVAMMQPTFLPWAGYFALVDAADLFVVLDDFQFQRHSFHQRNRVFIGREVRWVTVPVRHPHDEQFPLLSEVEPVLTQRFRTKLLRSLQQTYGTSGHFATVSAGIREALERPWDTLADLNCELIRYVCLLLGITTDIKRSSAVGSSGRRSARVADLLERVRATTYLAAAGAEEYMREDGVFPLTHIETLFQRYAPVPYRQSQSDDFVSHLSVLDLLFQVGPGEAATAVRAGAGEFVPWSADATPETVLP
jgi:hypothetical protein